jgi:hypothetical protein
MVLKIDELSKLGKVEVEFEVVKGLKIKLHTLSMEEQHRALTSVPVSLNDATGQFHFLQRALLIEATETINDEKPNKDELVKFYSEIQESVFQSIAERYTTLLQQQNEVTQELKKDFPVAASR